jgi:hypothetical protein
MPIRTKTMAMAAAIQCGAEGLRERNEDHVAHVVSQRHVPVSPELLQIALGERPVEVLLDVDSKQAGDADGNIAKAGEVQIKVSAETGDGDGKINPVMGQAVS